ncbi:anti-virulence regulator CigR family protein [Thioalbus denitrificans]|uniref:Nickel/cobalt transporter regulator n=1 Tax=Thioalbus denitrificans TaxID=547122 RepID=A0A369CEN9_9GAMM|nr:anti-virulence regulator CigR family protein [Thioalbus denitrificans]RCX32041.1 nickel/cobalt transporter regulator [Thioalbus denitrificans]
MGHSVRRCLYTLLGALVVVGLALSPLQAAPPEGKGNGKSHEKVQNGPERNGKSGMNGHGERGKDDRNAAAVEDLVTTGLTVAAIEGLLGERRRELLYSGAKPLPPGIRKNLARGKPLPPGIAKRYVNPDLRSALPYHDGYDWVQTGSDLVLIQAATGLVSEVIRNVFH